ncbi:MAG TPA: DUF4440 domain-containing protein [Acidimicrobiales bacterium]|jgi:ketosteroid isomerase-like protein
MTGENEAFGDALQRVERAVRAVCVGEHQLFEEIWSHADDASLFGAFGPARRGWRELSVVFPWVASRYRDGTVDIEYEVVWEGTDAAYTVGYERAHVSIDGGAMEDSAIRVTHIFRREGGRWMLVHRHGDFAIADDSPRPSDESS